LLLLQLHVFGKAPLLHGHYPASSLLWTYPTPDQAGRRLWIPCCRWLPCCQPPGQVSQAPRLPFPRALSPFTPEGSTAASSASSPPMAGFPNSGSLAAPTLCNEAVSGSLLLRLACSPPRASWHGSLRDTPGQLLAERYWQGKLLSAYKVSQAYPGTPERTETTKISLCPLCPLWFKQSVPFGKGSAD
jgi:hypothetical protein